MKQPLTISAAGVKGLFDTVIQLGSSPDQLESITGLKKDQLADPDVRIPLDKHIKLWKAAVQLTKDPALGLHMGEYFDPKHVGIVECVAKNCSTVREAVHQIIRYIKLISEADRVELQEKEDYANIIFMIEVPEYYTFVILCC